MGSITPMRRSHNTQIAPSNRHFNLHLLRRLFQGQASTSSQHQGRLHLWHLLRLELRLLNHTQRIQGIPVTRGILHNLVFLPGNHPGSQVRTHQHMVRQLQMQAQQAQQVRLVALTSLRRLKSQARLRVSGLRVYNSTSCDALRAQWQQEHQPHQLLPYKFL